MEWILDRNAINACDKLKFDFSRPIKSVLNDEKLFDVILANKQEKLDNGSTN